MGLGRYRCRRACQRDLPVNYQDHWEPLITTWTTTTSRLSLHRRSQIIPLSRPVRVIKAGESTYPAITIVLLLLLRLIMVIVQAAEQTILGILLTRTLDLFKKPYQQIVLIKRLS